MVGWYILPMIEKMWRKKNGGVVGKSIFEEGGEGKNGGEGEKWRMGGEREGEIPEGGNDEIIGKWGLVGDWWNRNEKVMCVWGVGNSFGLGRRDE